MLKNRALNLYQSLPKMFKWSIDKNIINIIFYVSWFFIIVGIVVMICGLTINNLSNQQKLIIGLSGVGISFLFLLIYYCYEYLRRKTVIKLNNIFNFINIYQEPLIKDKLISDEIIKLEQLKNEFCVLHVRYAGMISPNININKKYGIYELTNKAKNIIFSYFEINELGYKKKLNNNIQCVFKTSININEVHLMITKINRLSLGNHGYENKKQFKEFDIYFNTSKDLKIAQKIINNKKLTLDSMNIDLQIENNQLLVYSIRNISYLLLDVAFFKFSKIDFKETFNQIEVDYRDFTNILSFINKVVCDENKLKR